MQRWASMDHDVQLWFDQEGAVGELLMESVLAETKFLFEFDRLVDFSHAIHALE